MWHFKICITLFTGSVVLGILLTLFTNRWSFRIKTTNGIPWVFIEATAGISLAIYSIGILGSKIFMLINYKEFLVLGIGAIICLGAIFIYEIFKTRLKA